MSIPRDLLDQLLTGYLDDALSRDEQARMEQLLKSDPEVARELTQLRQLRQALQTIATQDSGIKLGDGFAQRVLDAAVDRARSEGLDDDHPLVRLAEQPVSDKVQRDSETARRWRYSLWSYVSIAAVAASLLIAVVWIRSTSNMPDGVASTNGGDGGGALVVVDDADATVNEATGETVPDAIASTVQRSSNASMTDTMEPQSTELTEPSTPDVSPSVAEATDRPGDADEMQIDASADPGTEAVAVAEAIAVAETEDSARQADPSLRLALGTVVVFDVRQTETGRQDNAVIAAIRESSLELPSRMELESDLVGVTPVGDDSIEAIEEASIFLIRAPAKKLDRFYLRLLLDTEGIESVGMTIASNVPILDSPSATKSQPTAIRHSESSLVLDGDADVVAMLAGRLDRLPYARMSRDGGGVLGSNGPDIQTQVLLLVR